MRSVRARGPLLLTPVLVLAVVVGALLPPEHTHLAGIEGRTHSITHRHVLDPGPGALGASIAAHGSHDLALFLSTFYDSVFRFITHAPAVVEAAIILVPSPGPLESARADDAQRAHGPPGSTCPTRAPPSIG